MKLGLIGAPGSGKDIIAKYFVETKGFIKFAFADQIKKEYYALTGFTEKQFKYSRGKSLENKIRNGLWSYSAKKTENDKFYFIHPVIKEVEKVDGPVIITDVRTQAELKTIEIIGFQPILILRNFKEELKGSFKLELGKVIPGTKIKVSTAVEFPIFWNTLNDILETYINLEKFYQELKESR